MNNIDLLHYIQQARKSGMGDNKIREGLLQAGWPVSSVEEAITKAPVTDDSQPRSKAMMSKSLAVIFTVIAIAVVGYFAGAYYMANFQSFPLWPFEVSVPVSTFTPRPSPSNLEAKLPSDVPADWQTYRNEEYGFEMEYPESWRINTDFPNLIAGEFMISFRSEKYKNALDWTGLIIQSYPDNYANYTEAQSFIHEDVESLIKYKTNSRYIYGSCTNYDDDISEMCDQILSTFKFLE